MELEAFLSVICSDRMRELKSKIEITDMTNEHQVACLAEEYKDLLQALECPVFDNLREQCSLLPIPTGGPSHPPALADNTHQSPTSEENTRPPTTLADKNPRPLPPSLKELQKKKYAAVKAHSRNPTPANKYIMQALNRETKQRIAEFKRHRNNPTEKSSPKRQVTDNIDQRQINRFADEDEDDTNPDNKDTDDEDTDNEDTDDEAIINDDIENKDIDDEETYNEDIDNKDINKEDTGHDDIENEDINSEFVDKCNINNKNIDNNDKYKKDTNNEETKDECRRRLSDEYKDVINWAEGLCARALRAYAYTAESTSQNPPISSEKWGLRDDYMSARLKYYMSKIEANFTSEERRQKARFSSEFMDWTRKLEENLLLMLPSPTAGICEHQLQPATTNTSQALPSDDNASQSLPCKNTDIEDTENRDNYNEDAVGEDTDNENTDKKETTKDAYRRLSEEYKDVIDWSEKLRERALHVTSASTSKCLPVSSDAETWTACDANMTARLKEYLSKVALLPPAAAEERRRHNSCLADDFMDWIFEFMKTMILLSPTAAATFASLTKAGTSQSVPNNNKVNKDIDNAVTNDGDTKEEDSEQATQRLLHTPTEQTSQPQPGENTNDEDSDDGDTEDDVDSDDVDTGDEDTDEEDTGDEDTDDEETYDEDTDDEPLPPPPKNSAPFLASVAITRRPLVAAENINRSPRQAENANQLRPPVASTSRYLPLNENTSLNSRQSQAPVNDTRPLPPALKELQRRKFAALKEYSRFPSPNNKRILKTLEQEAKRGIAEFRRMVQRTASIGERFDEFCSKLKVIDVNNRNETKCLAADYKDVLECYFSQGAGPMLHLSNLLYHESVQRATGVANRRRPPPAHPRVPAALQELLRRKRAALMIYRSYSSPENKIILRALEKEVKQGLAEFRRTGN